LSFQVEREPFRTYPANIVSFVMEATSSRQMKTILFIAHVPCEPGPEHAAGTWLMARRLQNYRERSPAAMHLLVAAAMPRMGVVPNFTSSSSKGLFR
jgi:hypothetical protein